MWSLWQYIQFALLYLKYIGFFITSILNILQCVKVGFLVEFCTLNLINYYPSSITSAFTYDVTINLYQVSKCYNGWWCLTIIENAAEWCALWSFQWNYVWGVESRSIPTFVIYWCKKSVIPHSSTSHVTVELPSMELPSMLLLYSVWQKAVLEFSCK